jgi:hypothetical protein
MLDTPRRFRYGYDEDTRVMADRLTDAIIKRLPLPERASRIHPDGDVPG